MEILFPFCFFEDNESLAQKHLSGKQDIWGGLYSNYKVK